jgi:hypothetical protein
VRIEPASELREHMSYGLLLLGGTSTAGAPYRRPLGAAWPASLDPMQHSDAPHAIALRRPRDTGGTPCMPDDWGNALVRWVVLLELEEVIAQRLKG